MPETSQLAAPPAAPGRTLRLVMFGMPNAGKSSLLGALAQAAQAQREVLGGDLIDRSQGGLEILRQRVYENKPRRTMDEIVAYPVTFQPFPAQENGPARSPVNADLIDCDGQKAYELLKRQKALAGAANGSLAGAV